ncbi:DNA-binding NtrC family response regulator [Rhodopirellula rubra]|uniref:DNA-binding NtrC family response regulator n=1 Tax=Aporhodopirellula rubra TaxID=980271 RepID=A0A7W5E255_9BACT|nr:sigma-54 dependent transcriptional regulator [Aporhodopirellula rubra]MBB3208820.1 DNA-binding NtrC family response regulator [Aporhodopirellula rubra]
MSEKPIKLLLVEDEHDFRETCARWMQRKGHNVTAVSSGAEALGLCEQEVFEVAVFDMNMPGMSGMELLQRVHQAKIEMEVIILTGQGTIESAVSAMKLGACDYLTKPCALGDLEHHCQLARDLGRLRKENRQLKAVISRDRPRVPLIGKSPAMSEVTRMIEKIGPTDKPVLLQGESGTGKEVIARSIQQSSRLRDQPFVTINCAALPEQLVESELFGHTKGSFTGATADKPGLFEIADGGTLFIDEVGELPLTLQPKLLRVLEDGSMRRIGSHKELHVNVRIIAATNRDLSIEVREGHFREDLFYRINVLSLHLPPLRDRVGDVDELIRHYLTPPWHIDDAAHHALVQYQWPGNVRQLINVLQRAMILADSNDITLDDLPEEIVTGFDGSLPSPMRQHAPVGPTYAAPSSNGHAPAAAHPVSAEPANVKLDDIARAHVMDVLAQENGNKARTARRLGIHRRKLYRLLERFEANANTEANAEAETNHSEVEGNTHFGQH